jgi:hypothetical protein
MNDAPSPSPKPPLSVRVSRVINRLTGGTPGVTLSAESERRRRAGRWLGYAMVWIIDTWTRDPDHCAKAWRLEGERGRWNV